MDAGHVISPEAPEDRIEPTVLNGAFSLSEDGKSVINGDGTMALRATGTENARIVQKMLNFSHHRA